MRYDANVSFVRGRCIGQLAPIVLALCAVASAAQAAVPAGAVVRIDRVVDVAAFRHIVEARYFIVLQRVVAADIDRDGDVDVVATTDLGFVVWVNDGAGRLQSQAAKHRPALDGRVPGDTWQGTAERTEQTIQNDVPLVPLPGESAHGPPAVASRPLSARTTTLHADPRHGASSPRAPPRFHR